MKRLTVQRVLALTAAALLVTAPVLVRTQASAAEMSEGLLCDTDPNQTFSLTASDGYVSTPDGLQVWDAPDGRWSRPPGSGMGVAR